VTPAARYCVLHGASYQVLSGSNLPTEQGRCRFGNGKACAADAFFNGLCAPDSAGEVVLALFRCDAGRTVHAVFSNGPRSSVSLVLSDGRSLSLPQSRSASGARYANADQSFVFWNKGDTAFIEENGQPSYGGCRTRP
jgi:membrane-bound inhibitor of C-type lysozyme